MNVLVLDSLDAVLSWDLPDHATGDALTAHTCLLAGACADDLGSDAIY